MASSPPAEEIPFTPFAIITPTLILVPTPIAINVQSYRALYAKLHADPTFCTMAFAHHFPPTNWTDSETRETIHTRDVVRCWQKRGTGDFAVGLLPSHFYTNFEHLQNWVGFDIGKVIGEGIRIIDDYGFEKLYGRDGKGLEGMEWMGYAGVRDATTTSLPEHLPSKPPLPDWMEMIELRYGLAEEYWGKGIAKGAAEAVMLWGQNERGVRRFIAETERGNAGSGKVLQKLGFVLRGRSRGGVTGRRRVKLSGRGWYLLGMRHELTRSSARL